MEVRIVLKPLLSVNQLERLAIMIHSTVKPPTDELESNVSTLLAWEIELFNVHSTPNVVQGPSLGTCLFAAGIQMCRLLPTTLGSLRYDALLY